MIAHETNRRLWPYLAIAALCVSFLASMIWPVPTECPEPVPIQRPMDLDTLDALDTCESSLHTIARDYDTDVLTADLHGYERRMYEEFDQSVFVRTGKPEKGIGSRMCRAGDRWCGKSSLCKLPALDESGDMVNRRIMPTDHVVAHRTYPCGTYLLICNPDNGQCTVATRATSGPFGAKLAVDGSRPQVIKRGHPWGTKIHSYDPGEWWGILDMTDSVTNAIVHDGWGPVLVYRLARHPMGE